MQGHSKTLLVSLVLMASVLSPTVAALSPEGSEEDAAPKLVVRCESYSVSILDAYAVAEVERVLFNPGNEPVNHTFEFTIPSGALISNFSIEVDNTTFYADVLEKEEAEERYQDAVASGHNAGLVALKAGQTFEYKVSFKPGEELTANLRYEQVLLKERGWHTYDLPLSAALAGQLRERLDVVLHIDSPSDIVEMVTEGYDEDIATLRADARSAELSLHKTQVKPEDDLRVRWRTGGGTPEGAVLFGERNGMMYFLHVYDPDPSLFGDARVPKDFVFIMDISGSMSGRKFDQSKEALGHIYGGLSAEDRFSMVEFDSTAYVYSPSLLSAGEAQVNLVLQHIRDLETGGSTNIHTGVVHALDIFEEAGETVPVIVLLTDGLANTGLYHRSSFREDVGQKNTVNASIFCIALGDDADWTFLEALALENDGRSIWVDEDEDVVTRITDFVSTFSSPLMADLSFSYGDAAKDVHPQDLPAHFEGSEVLVAGVLPLGVDELPMTLTATLPDGERSMETTFVVPDGPGHEFVPRFWAFQRIKDLEDRMKWNGTDKATVEEIIDLAIEFHFVTDHTSLFVELPEEIQDRFQNLTGPRDPNVDVSSEAHHASRHPNVRFLWCSTPQGLPQSGGTTLGPSKAQPSNQQATVTGSNTSGPGSVDLDGSGLGDTKDKRVPGDHGGSLGCEAEDDGLPPTFRGGAAVACVALLVASAVAAVLVRRRRGGGPGRGPGRGPS